MKRTTIDWRAAGWTCRPRTGREYARLRAGKPDPVRLVGAVPPCRVCRGREFTLRADPRLAKKLTRQCLPCMRRRAATYRRNHGDQVRAYSRKWLKSWRIRRILEELA